MCRVNTGLRTPRGEGLTGNRVKLNGWFPHFTVTGRPLIPSNPIVDIVAVPYIYTLISATPRIPPFFSAPDR